MSVVKLGLKENWRQFTLLVIINAFVGGMIGLERSILPRIAQTEFHITAKTAIFSFIIVFGITKAITNYFTGALANRAGRKNLLTAGWLIGIPVPFVLMYADSWNWIVAANVLLGINQGLTWSSTVVMKIDLVGEKQRGFAMGLNEFAGYGAIALVAFFTGLIASEYGLRPYPFYIGVVLSFSGFISSWLLVRDTKHHIAAETLNSKIPRLSNIFWQTTWKNRNLGSVTQAGLVNNLNDGMVWGLFPILLATKGFHIEQIGIITAIYPAVWGIGQLFTGKMADHFCLAAAKAAQDRRQQVRHLAKRVALVIHIQPGNDHPDTLHGQFFTNSGDLFIKKLRLINTHHINIICHQQYLLGIVHRR